MILLQRQEIRESIENFVYIVVFKKLLAPKKTLTASWTTVT